MAQSKQKSTFLTIFGIFFTILFLFVILRLNTGEFKSVNNLANDFLYLMRSRQYLKAFRFVDSSTIKADELKEVANLATFYNSGSFFIQNNDSQYITGFKPDTTDNEKLNDKTLEFWIEKIKGEWKVIKILYDDKKFP